MTELAINWGAVIVSMVISVVLGFLWYGPLFGKQWMALSGIAMPEQRPPASTMVRPVIISLIGALFMSTTLAIAVGIARSLGQTGLGCAFAIAVTNWLGFIVPAHLNSVAWEGKSWKLLSINVGYWLVYTAIASAIVMSWA